MYEQYWRLTRPPFRNDCDPDFFFRSQTHQSALLKLRFVVREQWGTGLLVAGLGYGKSYVVALLEQEWQQTDSPIVHLRYPRMNPAEMLSYIAAGLGADESHIGGGCDDLSRTVRQIEIGLARSAQQGRQPIIVIDNAHFIEDARVFPALQMLLSYQQQPETRFSLLLVGEPALLGRIGQSGPIAELVGATAVLQPLSAGETADYVAHRLEVAGRTEPAFDQGALCSLFELSGGIPRRINRLCDLALLVGQAEGLEQITADVLEAVAEELTLDLAA